MEPASSAPIPHYLLRVVKIQIAGWYQRSPPIQGMYDSEVKGYIACIRESSAAWLKAIRPISWTYI